MKVVLVFPRARNQNQRDVLLCLLPRHAQGVYEALFLVSFFASLIGPCEGIMRPENPV